MLAQDILNINTQADAAQAVAAKQKDIAIWESRAQLAGAISNLLGQETIAGKVAGIAEATINTFVGATKALTLGPPQGRSEEHTSELQSLMRISYAVFCLKKNKTRNKTTA